MLTIHDAQQAIRHAAPYAHIFKCERKPRNAVHCLTLEHFKIEVSGQPTEPFNVLGEVTAKRHNGRIVLDWGESTGEVSVAYRKAA